MKILLLQLDGKLPNLALMRIAAHHRERGDEVTLRRAANIQAVQRRLGDPVADRVYASLIFTRTRPVAAAVAQAHPGAHIADGPVGLEATFYLPCPKSAPKRQPAFPAKRPDLDKLVRVVADALSGVLWHDDAQVTALVARKRYVGRQDDAGPVKIPRAEITVQGGA